MALGVRNSFFPMTKELSLQPYKANTAEDRRNTHYALPQFPGCTLQESNVHFSKHLDVFNPSSSNQACRQIECRVTLQQSFRSPMFPIPDILHSFQAEADDEREREHIRQFDRPCCSTTRSDVGRARD
ncbi:hypothetical protein Mapa_001523 [Marchantia paleacea]|nr:hypothetical protein Mapa_001523 [Marchantia paleacea]